MNLVIVGCSRRKLATDVPVPALELYEGGAVPRLRERVAAKPAWRNRVWVLSAEHGLVPADRPLLPYDRLLTLERAEELRPQVAEAVRRALGELRSGEVLTIVEPLYLVCLADLLTAPNRPAIRWVPDPVGGWASAAAVLDRWGWR